MISHGYVYKARAQLIDDACNCALAGAAMLADLENDAAIDVALMTLVRACSMLQSAIALTALSDQSLSDQTKRAAL